MTQEIKLSDDLKKFLCKMEEIDRGSVAAFFNNCSDPKRALERLNSSIKYYANDAENGLFTWDNSPQGHAYWDNLLWEAFDYVINDE